MLSWKMRGSRISALLIPGHSSSTNRESSRPFLRRPAAGIPIDINFISRFPELVFFLIQTPLPVWFRTQFNLKGTSLCERCVWKPEPLLGLAVQAGPLNIIVFRRVVQGFDNKFLSGVVIGVQLDPDFVEYRAGNFVHRGCGRVSGDAEEANGHQRAYSSHLPLVFIVAAITFVRRDSAIGLLLHPADPVLGEPGLTRVAENVGVGTAGLIGIANVPVAVAVNEIFFL